MLLFLSWTRSRYKSRWNLDIFFFEQLKMRHHKEKEHFSDWLCTSFVALTNEQTQTHPQMHGPANGENCKRFCPTLVSKVLLVCQPSRSVSRPKMSWCWNVEFLQCCCHLTSFLSAYRLIQNSRSLSNDMRDQREHVGNCMPAQSDSRNVFFFLLRSLLNQRHSFIVCRCSWVRQLLSFRQLPFWV